MIVIDDKITAFEIQDNRVVFTCFRAACSGLGHFALVLLHLDVHRCYSPAWGPHSLVCDGFNDICCVLYTHILSGVISVLPLSRRVSTPRRRGRRLFASDRLAYSIRVVDKCYFVSLMSCLP